MAERTWKDPAPDEALRCHEDLGDEPCDEPAVAFTRDFEAFEGQLPVYPVCGRHARAHWRDLVTIDETIELLHP